MSYVQGRYYCCRCGHKCTPVYQMIDEDDYDLEITTSDCCKDYVAEDKYLNDVIQDVKYPRVFKKT